MYIEKIKISNIRSISRFEMNFTDFPGWHVLIGDNGAGKSTIIRSIALTLIGDLQAQGLTPNWNNWLNKNAEKGEIKLELTMDGQLDSFWRDDEEINFKKNKSLFMETTLLRRNKGEAADKENKESFLVKDMLSLTKGKTKFRHNQTDFWEGAFSAAYGPYRRFEGGNYELEKLFSHNFYRDLAAHLSVFSESVALTEVVKWLKELHHKSLEKDEKSKNTIENLKLLINSEDFLPHGAKLESINSDGVFFLDGNGATISVNQMSDGYRSILSLTFELIRQLIEVYGTTLVFRNIKKDKMFIDLPGVVLIDEIDAHLHPTWQTRIGQWFIKYFPKIQFIVTTHSPLVCRASKEGSIWRLAAPNSELPSGEITGIDKERLIFGNILDAYGTEVFGQDVSISKDSNEKLDELANLNIKSLLGKISKKESAQMEELKAVFPTEKLETGKLK